jgi:hypothetical protein
MKPANFFYEIPDAGSSRIPLKGKAKQSTEKGMFKDNKLCATVGYVISWQGWCIVCYFLMDKASQQSIPCLSPFG